MMDIIITWTVLILLPDEENGLPGLINTLRSTNGFVKLMESPFYSLRMELYIPKLCIKLNDLISIKKLLQRMNINDAFDIMSANLSNMTSSLNDNVFISEIFHCASFEVSVFCCC
ncbi:unnamed protein product [Trichobilharzia regenti]|nr:unnamed protein product [Trichobilharzia regenti]